MNLRLGVVVLFILASSGFAQYIEGDVRREFGIKIGLVQFNYTSLGGSKSRELLEEFFSAYGYMGAVTTAGFSAGVSTELATGNFVKSDKSLIINSLELNPMIDLPFGTSLRLYTGFGGSLNFIKERSGASVRRRADFGLQFFVGAKLSPFPTFGLLGEYKGKILMTGDYEGNVIHHINLGVYYSAF